MNKRKTVAEARSKRYQSLFVAAFSAFMVASAGVAVFPGIAHLAAPFVCSGGTLVTDTSSLSLGPGRSGSRSQVSIFCADASGERSEVPGLLVMVVIVGELVIPFAAIGWWIATQVWPMPEPSAEDGDDDDDDDDDT